MSSFNSLEEAELVLTTEANFEYAKDLSRYLLESRVAACISLQNIKSSYWWDGRIESADEVQLLIKTTKSCLDEVKEIFSEKHSYEVPQFIHWPASLDLVYRDWYNQQISSKD